MKPEKLVEREVLAISKQLGFHLEVVDAKKTFTPNGRLSRRGNAPVGMADLVGNAPGGLFAAVELKAKGKISTIRQSQINWLLYKASLGCFACVVDGGEMFVDCWNYWIRLSSLDDKLAWCKTLLYNPAKEKEWLSKNRDATLSKAIHPFTFRGNFS